MRVILFFLAAVIIATIGFRHWMEETKIGAFYIGVTNDYELITSEVYDVGDYVDYTRGNAEGAWHSTD